MKVLVFDNDGTLTDTGPSKRRIPKEEVAAQLRALGVAAGGVLLVHTSFRAVGPVEGGPRGLIEALGLALGPRGTLVMPSWPDDGGVLFEPACRGEA